jgi:hypothetical protein
MNNTYILLRNNKESASLSFEAIRKSGLKSTDLIWVECQSVCWQHPHEIAELKELVSATSKTAVENEDYQSSEINITAKEKTPQNEGKKKLAFIEFMGETSTDRKGDDVVPFEDLDSTGMYKYAGIYNKEKKETNKSATDVKKSDPLHEIKEPYVKTPKEKIPSPKNNIIAKLPEPVKKVAVYAALILSGAIAMLLIKNIDGKNSTIAQQTVQQPISNPMLADTLIPETEEIATVSQSEEEPDKLEDIVLDQRPSAPAEENRTTNAIKKSIGNVKEGNTPVNENNNKEKIQQSNQPVSKMPETKTEPVENIASKLLLNANEYSVGSFGGIRNLEITLHNNSKYLLEKVTAEIKYLNPEGTVLKTENIHFTSVQPGTKETIPVNKTKRGVKIAYQVIKIEPKETGAPIAGF